MNESIFFYLHSLAHTNPVFDMLVIFVSKYFGWIVIFFALLFIFLKIFKILFSHKNGNPSLYDMTIKEYGIHLGAGFTTIMLRVFGSRPEYFVNSNSTLDSKIEFSKSLFEEKKKEYEKSKYALATIALSSVSAWTLSIILKMFFGASRPFVLFPDIKTLVEYGWNDSFPSGHAMFFSALAVAILFSYRKVGFLYIIFALLIGVSRVIAGIHFPVDVVFGWIFGAVVAVLVRITLVRLKVFSKKEIEILPEKE